MADLDVDQSVSFAFGPDRVRLTATAGSQSVELHFSAEQAAKAAQQLAHYATQASTMQEATPLSADPGEFAVHAPPMTVDDIGETAEGDVALTMLDENGFRFAFRVDQDTARSIARSIAERLGLDAPDPARALH